MWPLRTPKLRPVAEVWEPLPMVRMLLPFVLGILLSDWGSLPSWLLVTAATLCALLTWRFHARSAGFIFLIILGFGVTQYQRTEPTIPFDTPATWAIRIVEEPAPRQGQAGGSVANGRIVAWRNGEGAWVAAADKIRIYTDSCLTLTRGDEVIARGRVRALALERVGTNSDTLASIRKHWRRQGCIGTIYLHEYQILTQTHKELHSLHATVVERLNRLPLSPTARAMVRAMAAGDRSLLTPELRQRFSQSGLTHLLAVSGLHTGLLFLWVNLLLFGLLIFRHGHVVRNLLAIGAVWIFAASAGYPASALRAAIMCSFLQLALTSARHYEPLNILATAAFLLLLYHPAWLGDLGFQLSFTAVAALLLVATPLHRLLRTRHSAVNYVVDSLIVCTTATFSTAPLVAHAFGSVSLAGILITPLALIPAAVIILLGALWMLLPVAWLATPCAYGIEWSARGLELLVERVGSGGTIEWHPSGVTLFVCYALLCGVGFFLMRLPHRNTI